MADVEVQLHDVLSKDATYNALDAYRTNTDADGRFQLEQVPIGTARVVVHKPGYIRPGLGESIKTPAKDISLTMTASGQIRVTVDFSKTARSGDYIVELEPEGGNVVGSWGGSGNIND